MKDKLKNDFDKMIEILDNQSPKVLLPSFGFEDCSKYEIQKSDTKGCEKQIGIRSLSIAFVFNSRNRFVGICNWKW